MNIILFGAPGAGKGTQASKIVEKYDLVHISTGDMFRNAIANKTQMGLLANSYISKGMLVPDEVTVGLVKERLAQEDIKKGFILDGFPRTLPQARCLDEILQELNIKLDSVIDIEVEIGKLLPRLTGRRVCKNCGASFHVIYNAPKVDGVCDLCNNELYTRKDDNEESVSVRLEAYENQTKPLIEFYNEKGILLKINGDQEINDVFKEIVNNLGE